jgi:hypothetical protein
MNGVTMYRALRVRLCLVILVIGTATAACNQASSDRLPVFKVKGKVLYKGTPLAGALVVFERSGGPSAGTSGVRGSGPIRATARTSSDGSFQLMTYVGNDGAPSGDYLVGISSVPRHAETNLLSTEGAPKSRANPDILRGRYADPKTSGLTARVEERDNDLPPFDLK